MADVFLTTISKLVDEVPGVTGAAFTDLDGEEIAIYPKARREELRLCAAYQGIAVRRLAGAEEKSGRGPLRSLTVQGTAGVVVTLKVGDQYQLIVQAGGSTAPARVLSAARRAADVLEKNI
jgi:predicted regulator of Ras-like GTPase activity (Roadblock/LC7/MglB family)